MAGISKDPDAGITGFLLGPSMASGKRDMRSGLPGSGQEAPCLLVHGYAEALGLHLFAGNT